MRIISLTEALRGIDYRIENLRDALKVKGLPFVVQEDFENRLDELDSFRDYLESISHDTHAIRIGFFRRIYNCIFACRRCKSERI